MQWFKPVYKAQNLVHSRINRAMPIFALSVVIALIYLPILQNGFLANWDDQWMIPKDLSLSELNLSTIYALFTEPYRGQYSPPIMLIYLAINYAAGNEAFAFHLFSLFVHLGNFILAGLIVKRLLEMIPDIDLKGNTRVWIAWATAFLFAIHPLQVESVAWISALKVPLYSFFYLLGLWFYLIYRQSGKHFFYGVVLLCFLCSLLTKEQAVVFVFSLVAADLVTAPQSLSEKKIWLEKIPFLIIAFFFGWFTLSISGMPGTGETYPFWQRAIFGSYSFWEYLIKLIVPHSLSHFYFFPMDPGESLPLRFWFYPLATGFLCVVLIEYRKHINKVYLFGGLFFLINIVIVLHLIPLPRAAIIADRYIYISAIGFFLIIVFTLAKWVSSRGAFARKTLVIAGSLYLLVLACYTHHRSRVWKNMETLNEDVKQVIEKHIGEFNIYDE